MTKRHMDQGVAGGDENIPGQERPLEPRLHWGKKDDEKRFRTQRNERRPWTDFWHSILNVGKKPKGE